jgi:hypothetical protein
MSSQPSGCGPGDPRAGATGARDGDSRRQLIDPSTGQVTTNQSIVVTGNRITSVGATAEVALRAR